MKIVKCKLKINLFLILVSLLLIAPKSVRADVLPQEKVIVRPNVIISATIGIPKMTLWGYGPAGSIIELSGVGVEQEIMSQPDGYYSFDLVYLPDATTFPELCVTAIDRAKNATPPTCIPPIGQGNYFFDVGPVILPPTISLGAPQTNPGSQVSAQGSTIPNSVIDIKLARPEEKQGILGLRIVEHVLAFYIPSYSVLSDARGEYSFNMPIEEGVTWRVFAITEYGAGSKSPKSNTLKFETLTPATFVWKSVSTFLATFLHWPRILFLEALIILILVICILVIIKKKRGKPSNGRHTESNQKYSQLVERYQELISSRNSNV